MAGSGTALALSPVVEREMDIIRLVSQVASLPVGRCASGISPGFVALQCVLELNALSVVHLTSHSDCKMSVSI
jgi:hypothetical protein